MDICINLSVTISRLWVCCSPSSISWFGWSVLQLLAACMPGFPVQTFGNTVHAQALFSKEPGWGWEHPLIALQGLQGGSCLRAIEQEELPEALVGKRVLILKAFTEKISLNLNELFSLVSIWSHWNTVSVGWRSCKSTFQTTLEVTHWRCAGRFLHLSYLFRCR